MGIAEEIEKLNKLRQDGAISEQEYGKAKESVLSKDQPPQGQFYETPSRSSTDVNVWSMYIHLSQFCGAIVPLAGLV
ncbi:MAG: SHOCT domain-containing protein, partial [Phycisphaerales bacterium]